MTWKSHKPIFYSPKRKENIVVLLFQEKLYFEFGSNTSQKVVMGLEI